MQENKTPIIIDKNFPVSITAQVEAVALKLSQLPAITSPDIQVIANKVLKEAKQLIKLVRAQGLVMRKPVSDLANEIMAIEKAILAPIEGPAQLINDSLTKYAIKLDEEAKTEKQKIEEEAREKLLVEEIRINGILKKIEGVRVYGLGEVLNCKTIEEVEEIRARLNTLKFNKEQYFEFTDQANEVKQNLLLSMDDKIAKINSGMLAEANKEIEEQKEQAQGDAQATADKAVQDAAANIQMESELKSSQLATPTGIAKRWKMTAITNMDQVPREFLCVDEKLVADAIKEGIYEIPGLKIEQVIHNVSR